MAADVFYIEPTRGIAEAAANRSDAGIYLQACQTLAEACSKERRPLVTQLLRARIMAAHEVVTGPNYSLNWRWFRESRPELVSQLSSDATAIQGLGVASEGKVNALLFGKSEITPSQAEERGDPVRAYIRAERRMADLAMEIAASHMALSGHTGRTYISAKQRIDEQDRAKPEDLLSLCAFRMAMAARIANDAHAVREMCERHPEIAETFAHDVALVNDLAMSADLSETARERAAAIAMSHVAPQQPTPAVPVHPADTHRAFPSPDGSAIVVRKRSAGSEQHDKVDNPIGPAVVTAHGEKYALDGRFMSRMEWEKASARMRQADESAPDVNR